MLKTTSETVTTTTTLEVGYADLLRVLRREMPDLFEERGIKHVGIYFEVPGGGDYSGMKVEIDSDNPVRVTVIREEVR